MRDIEFMYVREKRFTEYQFITLSEYEMYKSNVSFKVHTTSTQVFIIIIHLTHSLTVSFLPIRLRCKGTSLNFTVHRPRVIAFIVTAGDLPQLFLFNTVFVRKKQAHLPCILMEQHCVVVCYEISSLGFKEKAGFILFLNLPFYLF